MGHCSLRMPTDPLKISWVCFPCTQTLLKIFEKCFFILTTNTRFENGNISCLPPSICNLVCACLFMLKAESREYFYCLQLITSSVSCPKIQSFNCRLISSLSGFLKILQVLSLFLVPYFLRFKVSCCGRMMYMYTWVTLRCCSLK